MRLTLLYGLAYAAKNGAHLAHLTPDPGSHDKKPYLQWTYTDLHHASLILARAFQQHGIKRGSSVAHFLPNGIETILMLWVSAVLQVTLVPLDPGLLIAGREQQLQDYLARTKPQTVVVPNENDGQLMEVLAKENGVENVVIVEKSDTHSKWLSFMTIERPKVPNTSTLAQDPSIEMNGDRTALLVFTSGTSTGRPKGSPLTVRSLLCGSVNAMGMNGLRKEMIIHNAAFRIMFYAVSTAYFMRGLPVVLPSASFSTSSTLDALDKCHDSQMVLIPVQVNAFARDRSFSKRDLSGLSRVCQGGDIVTTDAIRRSKAVFPGKEATLAFGMSEGWGVIGWTDSDLDPLAVNYHGIMPIGTPLRGGRVRICEGGAGSKVLARGEAGHLHVGGPSIITHYLDNEQPGNFYTDERGSWMLTGDRALMDDAGRVFIIGRIKDIIKRTGVSLSPAVIETVLNSNEGIEAVVIAMPDDQYGEVPLAIVRDSPQATDHERIHKIVIDALGPDCALKDVIALSELGLTDFPLNQTAKVQKTELKEAVLRLPARPK